MADTLNTRDVFKEGVHGFGIRGARQLPVSNWLNLATHWLKEKGFIAAP